MNIHYETHTEPRNALHGQCVEFLTIKQVIHMFTTKATGIYIAL
jgi:hypothetical protein